MLRKVRIAVILIGIIVFLSGCSQVSRETIINNSQSFTNDNISSNLLDDIADKDSIVVGQFHGLKEHQEFLANLVIKSHQEIGLKQVMVESPHAFSWIFNGYGQGELDNDLFVQEIIYKWPVFLNRIREYNLSQESENRIAVRTGDANFHQDQFISSIQYLRQHLPERDTINRLLNNIITAEDREDVLEEFKEHLTVDKANYRDYWGPGWNKTLIEMIEIELTSLEIRNLWNDNYPDAHNMRENILKDIAEKQLTERGQTIFNFSFYHAQKQHQIGTRKEWLAGFLEKNYSHYSLLAVPISGEIKDENGGYKEVDLLTGNNRGELFRRTAEIVGSDSNIYLSLADPEFQKGKALMDLHFQKIEGIPNEIFDGIILFPEVTLLK
ncbi:MAG: hypothetical protein ACQEQG_01200 [Bacillota bacterium]